MQLDKGTQAPTWRATLLVWAMVVFGFAALINPQWVFAVAALAVICAFYMLPAIVAWSRRHRNALALTVANVLIGWTVIAWVALLVWALLRQEAPHERWTDEYWY